jgi:hypothetical protein
MVIPPALADFIPAPARIHPVSLARALPYRGRLVDWSGFLPYGLLALTCGYGCADPWVAVWRFSCWSCQT